MALWLSSAPFALVLLGLKLKRRAARFARFGGGLSRRAFAPGAFRLELRFIGRVRRFAPSAFAHAVAVLFEAAAVF